MKSFSARGLDHVEPRVAVVHGIVDDSSVVDEACHARIVCHFEFGSAARPARASAISAETMNGKRESVVTCVSKHKSNNRDDTRVGACVRTRRRVQQRQHPRVCTARGHPDLGQQRAPSAPKTRDGHFRDIRLRPVCLFSEEHQSITVRQLTLTFVGICLSLQKTSHTRRVWSVLECACSTAVLGPKTRKRLSGRASRLSVF